MHTLRKRTLKIEVKNSELNHRHGGYNVASSLRLIGVQMQGVRTRFVVNLKRIMTLMKVTFFNYRYALEDEKRKFFSALAVRSMSLFLYILIKLEIVPICSKTRLFMYNYKKVNTFIR